MPTKTAKFPCDTVIEDVIEDVIKHVVEDKIAYMKVYKKQDDQYIEYQSSIQTEM